MPKQLPRDTNGQLSAYTWPGGYPLYYLDSEMYVLCVACARQWEHCESVSYRPVNCVVNWEETGLLCDECRKRIECAYGDEQEI